MNTFTCSKCNKEIENTDTFTTGYGVDKNDNKVCFACCGVDDKEYMRNNGKIDLYLVKKDNRYHVVNWPSTLDFPVSYAKKGRHNIAGLRYDVWFTFEGKTWHGVNYGVNSEICHCKVTKN